MSNTKLTPYQGTDVVGATVAIRNAGDGLSKALGVDPVELKIGSTVHVVLECVVKGHNHQPIDADMPAGPLELVNVLKAGNATMVDAHLVREALDEQAKRIEQAQGIERLPGTDEADLAEKPADMTDEEWEASAGTDEVGEARAEKGKGKK